MTQQQFTKLLTQDLINKLCRLVYGRERQDIVQTALMRAYDNCEKFDGNSSFETWLHRIVINTSINRKNYHSKQSRKAEHLEFEEFDFHDKSQAPDHEAEAGQALSNLYSKLNDMDEMGAKAWVMYHTNDCTYQDLADELGGTVGSNKSRVSRANAILTTKV